MRTCHHEACYTTVTTVCVPTKVNCSLISVVPMHAWLSNVVRLSRCRDRRPRNRPVLRSRYRAAYRTGGPGGGAPDAPRIPPRRAGPDPGRTRTRAAPAPCVGRRGDPAPGTRRAARGIEAIRIAIRNAIGATRSYKSYMFVCRSGARVRSRSPGTRARRAQRPHSFTHYVHSNTGYRRATVSYRVIMRTY